MMAIKNALSCHANCPIKVTRRKFSVSSKILIPVITGAGSRNLGFEAVTPEWSRLTEIYIGLYTEWDQASTSHH